MNKNQSTMKRQQGVTAVGWLLIIALVGFFVMLALRLFPIYSNHYKIKNVVYSLVDEEQEGLYRISKRDLMKIFNRKLNINFAEGFKVDHLVFVIAKSGNREIHVTYEDRRPILGNLDVVAKFDNYVVVTPTGKVTIGL